jgi:hypothetical protein
LHGQGCRVGRRIHPQSSQMRETGLSSNNRVLER